MDSAKLNDWMQVIGIFAVVASLIFVGLQMKQAQDIALSQYNIDNLANKFTLSDKINAHSDIWLRGNAGEDLEESEAVVFWNLVRDRNDLAFFNVQRARRMGVHDAADSIIADFVGYLYDNPGAYHTWNKRQEMIERNRSVLAQNALKSFGFENEVRMQLEKMKVDLK